MEAVGIGPAETNNLIGALKSDPSVIEKNEIQRYVLANTSFPSTFEMAEASRRIWDIAAHNHAEQIISMPDTILLHWLETEYCIFRNLEESLYLPSIQIGFAEMEDFIKLANTILNRRKSRAGTSFELQLAALFRGNNLSFTAQPKTEGKKKPDFLFPSEAACHDSSFPQKNLIMLAAKTTCKDRWRQILVEAGKLRNQIKFLCTIQQGISREQLDEMEKEKVILVVPEKYIAYYPKDRQQYIWTIKKFMNHVRSING